MAALLATTLLTGLASATGLVTGVGNLGILWLHIAGALVVLPLVHWHALARPTRPRRTDLSRRTALRAGVLGAVSVAGLGGTEVAVAALELPGARRRFTGSVETGRLVPALLPPTSWLDDRAPTVDAGPWRLAVADAAGTSHLALGELAAFSTTRRVTLDCTSGWYSEQDWTGVPLSALLPDRGSARSVLVTSRTGYSARLPLTDLDRLLLATAVGGAPLSALHGFPARLVAPGRRGFWWVKWVDRVELSSAPPWWRPPFPLT
nr:molybdopterin-dependent oxidoreductase [Kineococcus siccus]